MFYLYKFISQQEKSDGRLNNFQREFNDYWLRDEMDKQYQLEMKIVFLWNWKFVQKYIIRMD